MACLDAGIGEQWPLTTQGPLRALLYQMGTSQQRDQSAQGLPQSPCGDTTWGEISPTQGVAGWFLFALPSL